MRPLRVAAIILFPLRLTKCLLLRTVIPLALGAHSDQALDQARGALSCPRPQSALLYGQLA